MAKRLPCCADVKGKASNASLYFDIPNPISQSHYLSFPCDPNIKPNQKFLTLSSVLGPGHSA
jgi:hypothetical protein